MRYLKVHLNKFKITSKYKLGNLIQFFKSTIHHPYNISIMISHFPVPIPMSL